MLVGSPAVKDGKIFAGSDDGNLYAVDAWTFETDGMKKHGPSYTKPDGTPNEEAIYRSDFYDDMVAGVDRVMSMGAILSSPVVVGNVVYVGSADGNLYALR